MSTDYVHINAADGSEVWVNPLQVTTIGRNAAGTGTVIKLADGVNFEVDVQPFDVAEAFVKAMSGDSSSQV